MTRTKYPVEVASVVRQNKTLGFNSFLYRADSEENESPYKIYGKFSRYTISILDTSNGSKKSAKGNIRVSEIADIERRTQYAFNKHMQSETTPMVATTEQRAIAYTVRITSGSLKGKTPAEAILEGNGKMLMQQKKFLEENLSRYPNNKTQIDAINEAVKLYKDKKLKKDEIKTADNGGTITLYNAGMHPLVRNTRTDGKCFVYEISISWKVGANYPVNVVVCNYYAKVNKMNDGRLNVKDVDERSKVRLNVSLSEAEWFNILSSIEKNMNQFELLTARMIFNDADKTYKTIVNESKKANYMPSMTRSEQKNSSFTGNPSF
jgi:hypothetical protein